jgi:hypothetical protein
MMSRAETKGDRYRRNVVSKHGARCGQARGLDWGLPAVEIKLVGGSMGRVNVEKLE